MDSVEQLAARYEKAWNSRDLDAIASLHTVDSVFQLHALGGQEVVGREAIRATFAAFVSQFPDLHFARERLRVGSSHWVFESKLTAASAEIEIDCIDVIDVGDALVARKDTYLDTAGVLAKPAEAFVEAFAEAWRAPGDADRFADHFEAWFDPHVRFVQYSMPTFTGREGFREQFARPLFALMPDLHGTVTRWAAVGDDVYIELRLEGTLGRRTVTLHSCDRITLRDGKVVERVAHLDPAPLMAAVKRAPRIWPQVLRAQRRARARAT